jgi:hypothetical protein
MAEVLAIGDLYTADQMIRARDLYLARERLLRDPGRAHGILLRGAFRKGSRYSVSSAVAA